MSEGGGDVAGLAAAAGGGGVGGSPRSTDGYFVFRSGIPLRRAGLRGLSVPLPHHPPLLMLHSQAFCVCLPLPQHPPITSPSERKKAEKAAAKQRQVEEEQARQAEEAAKR